MVMTDDFELDGQRLRALNGGLVHPRRGHLLRRPTRFRNGLLQDGVTR